MRALLPGDYGVVKTNGWVGFLIRLGTISRWNHAFVYVGDGKIIEANPTGVAVSPVTKYPKVAWNQHESLTDAQRITIVAEARKAIGKPYSFGTITLLVMRILGLKALSRLPLVKKLASKNGYICSELVSECYTKAGFDLCGKADYLVVPGDLAERLIYQ